MADSVRVFVRTRPTANFPKEIIDFDEDNVDFKTVAIKLDPYYQDCVINNKRKSEWRFRFDGIFHQSSQESVYSTAVSPLISQAFDGYSACIMAYGQVGSGKSYTMVGPEDDFKTRGVIPRALTHLFNEMEIRDEESSSTVRVSYVEVYNDRLVDLLAGLTGNQSILTLTESLEGVVTANDLTMKTIGSEEDGLNMFFEGEFNRTVSYHPLNTLSSRSHAIFTVYLETSSKSQSNADVAVSTLHFVDLGGTERLNKSQPKGHVEDEAKSINKSLSFLEQVLLSVSSSKRFHVPYRQSKLTQYLSSSLHNKSNIVLLTTIRGELEFIDETISTLKFGNRVKGVSTYPVSVKTNDEEKLTSEYEKEIKLLKQELKMQDLLHSGGMTTYDALNEVQVNDIQKQVKDFIEGTVPELKVSTVRQTKEVFNQLKSYIRSQEQDMQESKVDSPKTKELRPEQSEISKASSRGNVKKSVSYNKTEDTKEPGLDDGFGITLGKAPSHLKCPTKTPAKKTSISRLSIPESQKKKRDSKVATSTGEGDSATENDNGVRPSTPPSKEQSFEIFKNGRGKELHAVFLQNKAILARKKKEIAAIKLKLKEMNDEIVQLQHEAETQQRDTGRNIMTTDGRMVLRECEYTTLVNLKQIKSEYKDLLLSLEATRTEVPVCFEHVSRCRKRLFSEFESWFKSAFIGDIGSKMESPPTDKPVVDREILVGEWLRKTKEADEMSSSIAYHRANQKAMKKVRTQKLSEKTLFLTTV